MKREYLTIWHKLQIKSKSANGAEKTIKHPPYLEGLGGALSALLGEVEKKIVKTVHERPSKEALDRMALFVGYQDWQSFLDSFEEEDSNEK